MLYLLILHHNSYKILKRFLQKYFGFARYTQLVWQPWLGRDSSWESFLDGLWFKHGASGHLCQWWPCTSDFRWALLLNGCFVTFTMAAFHVTGHGFGIVCLELMLWVKCVHRWTLITSLWAHVLLGMESVAQVVSSDVRVWSHWSPCYAAALLLSLHLPATCVKFRGKLTCLYIALCCCLFPSLEMEGLYGQHEGDPGRENQEKKTINSTVRQLNVSKLCNLIYWGGVYTNFVFNRLGFNTLWADNVSDGKGCWFWGLQVRACQHLFEGATFWYWGRRHCLQKGQSLESNCWNGDLSEKEVTARSVLYWTYPDTFWSFQVLCTTG